jgi:hypothetical protein
MAVVFECVLVNVVLVPARDPADDAPPSPPEAPGAPAVDDPLEERTPQLV